MFGVVYNMSPSDKIKNHIANLASQNINVRTTARQALVEAGQTAVNPLIQALEHDHIHQKANIIAALGIIGNAQVIPPLLAMKKHPNLLIRINTATALGRVGDKEIEQILVDWLNEEKDTLVQIELVNALARIGEESSITVFMSLLIHTPSATLRYLIIRHLGELNDKQAIAAILPFIDDPDQHVQSHAQDALVKLGHMGARQRDE